MAPPYGVAILFAFTPKQETCAFLDVELPKYNHIFVFPKYLLHNMQKGINGAS